MAASTRPPAFRLAGVDVVVDVEAGRREESKEAG
jgi:hypothetical protein